MAVLETGLKKISKSRYFCKVSRMHTPEIFSPQKLYMEQNCISLQTDIQDVCDLANYSKTTCQVVWAVTYRKIHLLAGMPSR